MSNPILFSKNNFNSFISSNNESLDIDRRLINRIDFRQIHREISRQTRGSNRMALYDENLYSVYTYIYIYISLDILLKLLPSEELRTSGVTAVRTLFS